MTRRELYSEVLRRLTRSMRLIGNGCCNVADALGTQRLFFDLGFTDWKGKRVKGKSAKETKR